MGFLEEAEIEFGGKNELQEVYAQFRTQLNLVRELNSIIDNQLTDAVRSHRESVFSSLSNNIDGLGQDEKTKAEEEITQLIEFFTTTKDSTRKQPQTEHADLTDEGAKTGPETKVEVTSDPVQEAIWRQTLLYVLESTADEVIRRMTLIYASALFEDTVKSLLTTFYRMEPRSLIESNKKIEIGRVARQESHEAMLAEVSERQVSDMVNGPLSSWNSMIKKRLDIDLSSLEEWQTAREGFARRNVIVHNGGVCDKKYARIFSSEVGQTLAVSEDYLAQALEAYQSVAKSLTEHLEEKIER